MPVTATTSTPCPCCGAQVACTSLECRKRGGTFTICGFDEYGSPSVPPKRYRTQTLSGSFQECFNFSPCAGAPTARYSQRSEFSGTYVYSPTNCTETNTQQRLRYETVTSTDQPCPPAGALLDTTTPNRTANLNNGDGTRMPATTTATQVTWTGTGVCSSWTTKTGTMAKTLTDEDTEADAISRANFTWGAWSAVSGPGCGGSCCLARWELRGAGDFTTTWQEAEWRAVASVPNGQHRTIKIDVYRRPFGSGSYTLFQTLTYFVTGGVDNTATVSDLVPNERGYETYVLCATP